MYKILLLLGRKQKSVLLMFTAFFVCRVDTLTFDNIKGRLDIFSQTQLKR